MILPRRSFLIGLGSLIAAPAIVRAASLMPIKGAPLGSLDIFAAMEDNHEFVFRASIPVPAWRSYNMGVPYSKSTTARARLLSPFAVSTPPDALLPWEPMPRPLAHY